MKLLALIKALRGGDPKALSRAITLVENRSNGHLALMKEVQKRSCSAAVIGITGPPGSGKSTLVDRLTAHLRTKGKKVGIIAVDPSSPFSGGALLGDRIRMQGHAGDPGVFIRSLGSRGAQGGLSRATREIIKLYNAFGIEWILVETVGVGQNELSIMEIADTTVVVLTPESGDTIQTMKAGLLEIADIFVVNKSDRDGAEQIRMELETMVELEVRKGWKPPVLPVEAVNDEGVGALLETIERHQLICRSEKNEKHSPMEREVLEILSEELRPELEARIKKIKLGREDNPYAVAESILKSLKLSSV